MSAAPERREPIDIDEFERRLRGPEPVRRPDDPLAELARLVGGQNQQAADPFAELFADNFRKPAPPVAAPVPMPAPPVAPPVAPPFAVPPAPPPVDAAAPQADPFADFPDLRPLLRGGDHGQMDFQPAPHPQDYAAPQPAYADSVAPSSQYEDWAEAPELSPDTAALEPPRERSKKPLYIAAAVIAAGFVAIGSTLAWRGGANQAGGVATIAASTNPTKVQPKDEGGDKPARESTMLERTQAPPVKKVVTRDEQPMDVAAAAKTPRIIPLEEGSGAPAGATPGSGSGAASVAPPPPPSREPSQRTAFPEPKRVKTVSVRADGSIIGGGDAAPAAPAAAPAKPTTSATPAPAKNATPKSATRAEATSVAAPPPKPAAAKPKVEARTESKPEAKPAPKPRVAAVQPKDEEPQAAAAEPADDEDAPKVSSGGYAVQVASAGSESEARQTASRLGEKLSGALGGRRPAVVKASDSLYRIRVTGLSKESANAMCGKVKAAGGACFVAR